MGKISFEIECPKIEVPLYADEICGFPVRDVKEMSLDNLKDWLIRIKSIAMESSLFKEILGISVANFASWVVMEERVNKDRFYFEKMMKYFYSMKISYAIVRNEIRIRVSEIDKQSN